MQGLIVIRPGKDKEGLTRPKFPPVDVRLPTLAEGSQHAVQPRRAGLCSHRPHGRAVTQLQADAAGYNSTSLSGADPSRACLWCTACARLADAFLSHQLTN